MNPTVQEGFGILIGNLCWPNIMRNQEKKTQKTKQSRGFSLNADFFGKIYGYLPVNVSVSPVTGVTFMWACNNTDVFAMGKSLTQSPALTLEVCQGRITEWFELRGTLKII